MPLRTLPYLGLFFTLLIVAACASTPAGGPLKSAESYYKDGETAYASRNYEDAVAQWKKVKES